jgi:16S rRNA (uracil1498-N3)-methyltransferase
VDSSAGRSSFLKAGGVAGEEGLLARGPRHHFFVAPWEPTGEVRFSAAQEHQIARVLRLRDGDLVVVLDGAGGEAAARLSVEGRRVAAMVQGPSRRCGEPALRVVVYQALIRPENFAWLLQKGTEVGVSAFVPLRTARSQHGGAPPAGRHERLRAILREAAEQSRRLHIPTLSEPRTLDEALTEIASSGAPAILLWEGQGAPRLSDALRGHLSPGMAIYLLVGPEGGWAPHEVDQARRAGLHLVSLGPRLLRAETAAVIGASGLLALAGDLL